MWECYEGEINMLVYLPCAGITLTRFYGYHLSHSVLDGTAPRGI